LDQEVEQRRWGRCLLPFFHRHMLYLICLFCVVALASGLTDRNELFEKYADIFPNQNRNAASHRWATYILEKSAEMTEKTLRDLFAGFCPVSGSPLAYNRPVSRWNMTLPTVSGGTSNGMLYYCCWPCVCDTMDFITIDTKTVQTSDGERQYHFAVIGDPCEQPDAIPPQASDVNCESNQLVRATFSDNGYVIIGMFFEPGVPDHSDSLVESTQHDVLSETCQARAASGHQSGMGMIFREVASISPITQRMPTMSGAATTSESASVSGLTTTIERATTIMESSAIVEATTTVAAVGASIVEAGTVGAATTGAAVGTTSTTISSIAHGTTTSYMVAASLANDDSIKTTTPLVKASLRGDTLSGAYSLRLASEVFVVVICPMLLVGV